MNRINQPLCDVMLGPSGLGLSGKLADGDRSRDLHRITVPTLVIGAGHDFMDPANLETMASRLRGAATSSVPTEATCRCTTTRRRSSAA
jgi:pimeloyl-ACP methyl ester carboxylesterase